MSGFDVLALLQALEAAGAHVATSPAGDALALTGKRPPADLLEELKARKPEVLAHLARRTLHSVDTPTAKGETSGPGLSLSPDVSPNSGDNLPPLPDWEGIAAQPGHCGSCARASDASEECGRFMVTCSCPANAFEGGFKPLALHMGHRCVAYINAGEETGRGYRAKGAPTHYGLTAPPSTSWEALPSLGDS